MSLDAIVIADCELESLSGSNPLRLNIEGRPADIQVVLNYLKNDGSLVTPIENDSKANWASAPKLNGIHLQSYLTHHGFDVALIDSYYQEREAFCNLLKQNPRTVIISTTFIHNKKQLKALVDDIRSLVPDIFIIVGGPFIYFSYLSLQRSGETHYAIDSIKHDYVFHNENEPSVDFYIISLKGEEVLREALKKIKLGMSLGDLPNSARLTGHTYQFSQAINDLSTAENFSINWNSVPAHLFKSEVMPMQASIGCTYRCTFCNFVKDTRLTHVKPIDQVIEELKIIARRGIRYVWFIDDNFRLGKRDINTICERFIEEDLGIQWMSFMRADALKNVDFDLLRRSGCRELQLGLESADAQILRSMNKSANSELYVEVIRKLLEVGINCSCYFIMGFPGETEETINHTIEFIKSIEFTELEGNLSWSIYPFMLAPFSPIYEANMRDKYGLSGYMNDWTHATMNSKQAREHIKRAFLEISDSGPIYRGDNQDILQGLTSLQRKNFAITRHRLEQLAVNKSLDKIQMTNMFSEVFSE